MREQEMTCNGCGSIYEIKRIKTIMRDKDSLNCEVCGNELLSWNGGAMYTAQLQKRATTKQTKS